MKRKMKLCDSLPEKWSSFTSGFKQYVRQTSEVVSGRAEPAGEGGGCLGDLMNPLGSAFMFLYERLRDLVTDVW